jgi:hypothetical protein
VTGSADQALLKPNARIPTTLALLKRGICLRWNEAVRQGAPVADQAVKLALAAAHQGDMIWIITIERTETSDALSDWTDDL